MRKKRMEDIRKEVDDILDMYFEELANCFEKRKDIQSLRGWLRVNLHKAFTGIKPPNEPWYKEAHPGIIALLAISVVNLVLLFFRYIVDPY